MPDRRRAFTLVELLVVLGIFTIVLGLLLPVITRAHEEGRRVQCMSNLQQIMRAVLSYGGDNKQYFPGSAVDSGLDSWAPFASDWIHWEPTRNVNDSSTALYLGRPVNPAIYRCPSDDATNHRLAPTWGPNTFQPKLMYPYSYCMLRNYGSAEAISYRKLMGRDDDWIVPKMSMVKDAARATLIGEVDERQLRDGAWEPGAANMWGELLSARHDRRARGGEKWKPGYVPEESYPDARGNVGFVDGHVEYMTRREAHDVRRWFPRLAAMK
jgi:prepilin-type N-terminal cleavage/methylation domain-containing protein/prepilin-type processing-associated H-X9-DG protein